ncbi:MULTISPECIES: hypothetical protein [unclassified Wolbachia]|uniref:hypothetical protein n=1 Tax=unclassified Wolbachia TaxID=2640676 RepID=UPI00222FA4E8|nr:MULTISPECIES: hypothetical protein [unclassified Wolbachia]GKS78714.1 hypothetical protein wHma_07210 [Wolbachia pipientis]
MEVVRSQYWDDTYGLFVMTKEGIIRVMDAEIQEPVLPFVIPVWNPGCALGLINVGFYVKRECF